MSCFGCSKKYGIFTKEYGCPNCGYSYCAKCLKRPIAVPKHSGKVENVCLICYDKLSKLANERVIDCEALPGTIITKASRRVATQDDVAGAAAIFEDELPADLGAVLSPVSLQAPTNDADAATNEIEENLDCIISKRLKDLKTSPTNENMPSDAALRSRLAALSGLPHKDYTHKDLLLATDQRSDQQKMQDLLTQFMGETQLDQRIDDERNDAISQIERRLRALRDTSDEASPQHSGGSGIVNTNTPSDNETEEEDEQTMLKRIMEKYLAEARLPPSADPLESELLSSLPLPPAGAASAAAAVDTEELPWCTICNEDAVYRCRECDGDLFCAACYRECHDDDEEYRQHVKVKYSAPPKFKEDHF